MHETTLPTRTAGHSSWLIALALVAWLGASLAAWYGVTAFGFTGEHVVDGEMPATWPADSAIIPSKNRPTLLLFLHPHCACSRATVEELERLSTLAPTGAPPSICVVASAPRSTGKLWQSTPLLNSIARLPNAHVFHDAGGVETARFGARVSGTVMLYDATGQRLYAGGVTMARGHDGHNAGIQAVADLLMDPDANAASVPAFGCKVVREVAPSVQRKDDAAAKATVDAASDEAATATGESR